LFLSLMVLAVLPDDYTWGCAPGYLCKPRHTGDRSECNVEAGLPTEAGTVVMLLDVLVDVVPGPVTVAVLGGGTGLVVCHGPWKYSDCR
jgi:hypothetical protein